MRTELLTDPVTLRDKVFPFLRTDPVLHSGHLSGISDAVRHAIPIAAAILYQDHKVAGLASCTAGRNIWLGPLPETAAPLAAAALAPVTPLATTVNGTAAATGAFVRAWASHTGRLSEIDQQTRLHKLEAFHPQPAPGQPRLAVPAEAGLCHDWLQTNLPGPMTAEILSARIAAGLIWLWEHGGRPVSLAGHHPPRFGAARIGPVCTPAQFRGNGYASALTSHLAGLLRGTGNQVCLFTDLANPTSNKIYSAIGFTPVADYMFRRLYAPR